MRALLNLVTALLRCALAYLRSRNEQAVVELALRQQLATYALEKTSPRLTPLDRAFWVALSRLWPHWRDSLVIVKPDTVIRWHRKGFRLYWRSISKRGPGRPPISDELQTLIRRLADENDWRARKIQAELKKLGFTIGLATVSRYLPKRTPDLGKQQRWMTFLRNHRHGITAMDFFVVPTVGFRLLYVWFMIDHGRRRIIHFDVTANPNAQWVIQQLREAFPYDSAPDYLIYGRVGRWRGDRRWRGVAVADGFRLNAGASVRFLAPFPDTLSSNRACGFPAHGSHLGLHAFALDRSRVSTSRGRYRPISRSADIG
jgi:hypothetical protein